MKFIQTFWLAALLLSLPGCMLLTGYLIGGWRDYNQKDFHVEIWNDHITVTQNQIVYEKKGRWGSHSYFCDAGLDAPQEVVAARELKDESLEVHMEYFKPDDKSVYTCVKTQRGLYEYHPFPINHGQVVKYPPPKGMIRVGTLVADLEYIPWGTTTVAQDYTDDVGPTVEHYHYRSDDPNLPELVVTVTNGRVTEVVGGAEDTNDPPYVPPPNDQISSEQEQGGQTWGGWFCNLILRK